MKDRNVELAFVALWIAIMLLNVWAFFYKIESTPVFVTMISGLLASYSGFKAWEFYRGKC